MRYPYPGGVGVPRLGQPCRLRVLSPVHEALSPTRSRRLEGLLRQKNFRTRRLVWSAESLYPNASYLSQKVMSEVSVSRRRRSPSARSALAAYLYSIVFRIHFRSSRKAQKTFWQKRSFSEEKFDAEGFPPSSPRGRVGLCRGKADPSLMTKLSVGTRHTNNLRAS